MSATGRRVLSRVGQIALNFDHGSAAGEPLRGHLSCVVASPDGRTLWLTSDETAAVERLLLSGDGISYGSHQTIDLRPLLALPGSEDREADIEGLALSQRYLWTVGSHSLARRRPRKGETAEEKLASLSGVKLEANRFLFGRVPLDGADENAGSLAQKAKSAAVGRLKAGRLPIGTKPKQLKSAAGRSALTALLYDDEHFGRFLDVPAKENGFDIGGMAVLGDRILLGLRGPVLRGYATIVEIAVAAEKDGHLSLASKPLGGAPYRKHFLDLEGLGVRSLLVRGEDLWILAGPTMDLDGPVRLYLWRGGARAGGGGSAVVRAGDVAYLCDLPHGDGDDHAEGATVLRFPGSHVDRLLVVYDGPAETRCIGAHGVLADLFALPEA